MLNENRKVLYFIHEEIVLNDLIVFSVKNKDNDFLFNILNIDGRTPKTMSVNWRSIHHIKQDLSEHITINTNNMNKLSKPKSFSVSNETLEVNFKGTICECANLLKSGIMNQTIILVGYADKWHEINALDLGADNSDLQSFKQFVEVMKLSLVDLGIISEEIKTDYSLKHEDFMGLEKEFPKHYYYKISKLDEYEKKQGGYSGKFTLRMTLRAIDKQNLSIDEWISSCEKDKETRLNKIDMKENLIDKFKEAGNEKIVPKRDTLGNSNITELELTEGNQLGIPVKKIEKISELEYSRNKQLYELGLLFEPRENSFNGFGFFVSLTSRVEDPEEDWNILINKITQEKSKNKVTPAVVAEIIHVTENTPISSIPVKKPISLQVFETLTPERISELQGLKERQEDIVKKNPVVKITDKKTYAEAKNTAAILLKASTAIDGKEGIENTATKYLNTFKTMLKNALLPIAKLTRDPYDEQKTIISTWENAEILREQAEKRAKLAKIKARTDELFAVPFTFSGSVYSIGTVYCLPSQIESASDEDFKTIVENGKTIKTALDAQALIESEKDKEIEKLRAQLAALGALNEVSNTESVATPANTVTETTVSNIPSSNPNSVGPQSGSMNQNKSPIVTTPAGYTMPPQENVLLNRLDLEHLEHIEKPAYLKCRSYYVRALNEVGTLMDEIMNNPDVTIKKSVKITKLSEILKKSV